MTSDDGNVSFVGRGRLTEMRKTNSKFTNVRISVVVDNHRQEDSAVYIQGEGMIAQEIAKQANGTEAWKILAVIVTAGMIEVTSVTKGPWATSGEPH